MSEQVAGVPQEPVVVVATTWVYPAGADPDDFNAGDFAVVIEWRGRGAWRVTRRGGHEELSRAGNWGWCIRPFQRRQYRFDSYEHAMEWALKVLPSVEVGGLTWPQYQAWVQQRRAARN